MKSTEKPRTLRKGSNCPTCETGKLIIRGQRYLANGTPDAQSTQLVCHIGQTEVACLGSLGCQRNTVWS